jgi:hypothetical protein
VTPPLDTQAKTERVSLAVSSEEYAALEFVAKAQELSGVGLVLRKMSVRHAVRYYHRMRRLLKT